MAGFARAAEWLRRIFPPSVNPGTRFPDIVSDDVQLVQQYDAGGIGFNNPPNLGFQDEFAAPPDGITVQAYVWNTFNPPGTGLSSVEQPESNLNYGLVYALSAQLKVVGAGPGLIIQGWPRIEYRQNIANSVPATSIAVPDEIRCGTILEFSAANGQPGTQQAWLPNGPGTISNPAILPRDGSCIGVIPPWAVLEMVFLNASGVDPVDSTIEVKGAITRVPVGVVPHAR